MREEQYLRYNILKECGYNAEQAAKALEFVDTNELGKVKAYAAAGVEAAGWVYKNYRRHPIEYKVGQAYKTDGAIIGKDGFHAFRDIKELFGEWLECGSTRIFEVELSGMMDYCVHNSRACASDIKVLRELTIGEAAELCGGFILMVRNKKPILLDRDEAIIDDERLVGAFLTSVCGYIMCDDGVNVTYTNRDGGVVYQRPSDGVILGLVPERKEVLR